MPMCDSLFLSQRITDWISVITSPGQNQSRTQDGGGEAVWLSSLSELASLFICVFAGGRGGESHVQWAPGLETGAPTEREPQQAAGWGADQRHERAGEADSQMLLHVCQIQKASVKGLKKRTKTWRWCIYTRILWIIGPVELPHNIDCISGIPKPDCRPV